MYLNRSDLIYLSLARAGGLPLPTERRGPPSEYEMEQLGLAGDRTPTSAAIRETERQLRRNRPLARGAGRLLAGLGSRLSSLGERLAAPAQAGRHAPQQHGCG